MSSPSDYTVTAHLAPGASTVAGHEGQDATVYTVTPNAPDADATEPLLTATVTPWRTEFTYAQGDAYLTTQDHATLPRHLRAAAVALAAQLQQAAL